MNEDLRKFDLMSTRAKIKFIDDLPSWDSVDAEYYELLCSELGLDYHEYDDVDVMWNDICRTYKGTEYIILCTSISLNDRQFSECFENIMDGGITFDDAYPKEMGSFASFQEAVKAALNITVDRVYPVGCYRWGNDAWIVKEMWIQECAGYDDYAQIKNYDLVYSLVYDHETHRLITVPNYTEEGAVIHWVYKEES